MRKRHQEDFCQALSVSPELKYEAEGGWGAADAHAKNDALLYREAVPELAPVYDVVCTATYPGMSKRMAMQIGGRDLPDTVQRPHWLTLVPQTRGAQRLLQKEAINLVEQIDAEAETLLEERREEGTAHPILKTVRRIIAKLVSLRLRACQGCPSALRAPTRLPQPSSPSQSRVTGLEKHSILSPLQP